ncbi:hypothetical protein DLJ61_13140 [Gordonia terrae]|uniref:Uncharacterized protein n=2 Tax=Gordonia terrae TaxID=2055 RepID=A0AAD0KCE9_9ACTN|nr:hypothetical protein BCM27_13040 [Gordonia terrae]AWO84332.1 hypothetical protein DLJ61_13140 [Gordonia terrae]
MMGATETMSQEKAESTSFAEAENSRPWTEVANLGRIIVKQLDLETTTDTLSRWMACRVAELISVAEMDAAARGEATDLILRLWERRSSWPHGWPTESIARALHWFDKPGRSVANVDGALSPWPHKLAEIQTLLKSEFELWMMIAVNSENILPDSGNEELGALELLDGYLNDDEAEYSRLLRSLRIEQKSTRTSKFAGLNPKELANQVREEIEDLSTRRKAAFEAAYATLYPDEEVEG